MDRTRRVGAIFVLIAALGSITCGGANRELREAVVSDDLARLDALLRDGASPNAIVEHQYGTYSLLSIAARRGSTRMVERLLAAGAEPNLDHGGQSALLEACFEQHLAVIRILLTRGADPNHKNQFDETCVTRIHKGIDEAIELEAIHMLAKTPRWSRAQVTVPVLVKLLKTKKYDALRAYFQHGVDVNTRDKQGRTALVVAAMNGMRDGVRFLLEAGADPSTKRFEEDFLTSRKVALAVWVRPVISAVRDPSLTTAAQRVAAFDSAIALVEVNVREEGAQWVERDRQARIRAEESAAEERAERQREATRTTKPSSSSTLPNLGNTAPICERPDIRACRETGKTCEKCFYELSLSGAPSQSPETRCSDRRHVPCGGQCCGTGYVCCVGKNGGEQCRMSQVGCKTGWDWERQKH